MKLVWFVLPLVLFGIMGMQESLADEASTEQNFSITQQELKIMVEDWMDNPDEDDINQRLGIMKAYYAFEETGNQLSHDQEGLVLMNQIRKMISLDMPREELDQLREQVRVELGLKTPSEQKTLYVNSNLVDCVGVGKHKCMQVREDQNSEWTNFYGSVVGFDFEQGTSYKILVKITDIENPPADASSKKYELIEILEKKSLSKHIPYKDTCAPGFVPLGKICVLDDRCGPGAYAGKVCIMDGVVKPYLRPLQQGSAGIAASDVVCAEGLSLIFKSHDGSPSCVKDNSKKKLLERGWQTSYPVFACTLEYAPVCGVDGKTYGNKCAITSNHVAVNHVGECKDITLTESNKDTSLFEETLRYASTPLEPDPEKGYSVLEIANGVYWLVSSGYQAMFMTTGEGVVAVDAPKPIGEKYLDAINEVTDEPITHMIYTHHHQDHTGAAGAIFPSDITYIAHNDAATLLEEENDPDRPLPTQIIDGDYNRIEIGNKIIDFYNLGDFHSKGNMLILLPEQKIAMLDDLMRPGESPYRAFGVTPDIDLYLQTHDTLQTIDFTVLISGHTEILATKKHIETNKMFTLDVMKNAQDALDVSDPQPIETCTTNTTTQWNEKLGNLDTFMIDHCTAMVEYLSTK